MAFWLWRFSSVRLVGTIRPTGILAPAKDERMGTNSENKMGRRQTRQEDSLRRGEAVVAVTENAGKTSKRSEFHLPRRHPLKVSEVRNTKRKNPDGVPLRDC